MIFLDPEDDSLFVAGSNMLLAVKRYDIAKQRKESEHLGDPKHALPALQILRGEKPLIENCARNHPQHAVGLSLENVEYTVLPRITAREQFAMLDGAGSWRSLLV